MSWTVSVQEVNTPDDYNLDGNDIWKTAEIIRGQTLATFEFKNTHYKDVKVYKRDAETEWLLSGATFRLESLSLEDGNQDDYKKELTTEGEGFVVFENVPNPVDFVHRL